MSSSSPEMGARKIVEVNGRVQPDDSVLVVTDDVLLPIGQLIAAAARERGAEVVLTVISKRDADGQEPPVAVATAMKTATVIFCPVQISITHTRAMRDALDSGTRALAMTQFDMDLLTRPALLDTDFAAQRDLCRRLGDVLADGSHISLTSAGGTDLSFSVEGRGCNVLNNIPDAGEIAPVPTIEVNVVPVHCSANGRIVADASVPYLGIGVLDEPVICDVEDGYITRITGGQQAKILKRKLRSFNNEECFNIAEMGIGLNPAAELTGVMLEDEGVMGTVHIGIGTSLMLGGEILAPMHYDLLMFAPVITVDGVVIQRDKEILLPAAAEKVTSA